MIMITTIIIFLYFLPCVYHIYIYMTRSSLMIQWLRLQAPTAGGTDSIPGWGIRIRMLCDVAKKKKERFKYIYIYI